MYDIFWSSYAYLSVYAQIQNLFRQVKHGDCIFVYLLENTQVFSLIYDNKNLFRWQNKNLT